MIKVVNLSKVYGKGDSEFTALSDINLEIPSECTVAIIGKSGSGKSTLMHILSGLDQPTDGSVEVDGQDLRHLKSRAMDQFRSKSMSFIFQSFFIEGNQTAYENVALPLEIAKVPFRLRRSLIIDALRAVGLEDKQNTLGSNLSGGQKQRLAIARAIVNKPKILFADEPTGNLDSTTGDSVIKLLFDLNKKLKCTLIIVTHDNELARKCRLQISLKDGHVQKIEGA